MKKRKFIEIDFIKGIAIIWIVVFHMYKDSSEYFIPLDNVSGVSFPHLMMCGPLGVNLFVICSGFLLAFSAHGKKETLMAFYSNRLKRLLPLYYCAIIFVLSLDYLFSRDNFFINIPSLLEHIFLVHTYTVNMFDIQGAWWFMGMVVQLYLFFPVLYILVKKISFFYNFTACLLLAVLARHIHIGNIDTNYSVFAFLPDFLVGMYLYRYDISNKLTNFIVPVILFCAFTMSLFLYLMANDIFIYAHWYGISRSLISMGVFMTLMLVYRFAIKPVSYIVLPIALFGTYSYAIYLFHRPLIYKFVDTASLNLNRYLTIMLFLSCMLLFGRMVTKGEKFFLSYIRRSYE